MAPVKTSAPLDRKSREGRNTYSEECTRSVAPPTTPLVVTEVSNWRTFTSNTMKGHFSCLLQCGLLLHGCSLHVSDDGKAWIGLPSKVRVSNGAVSMYGGKPVYDRVAEIPDRGRREAFQTAVLAALQAHPEANRVLAGGGRNA